jgi:hypothetical protein
MCADGIGGEVSMPYAPPGAGSVLEASVERAGICVSVREHSVFSVSLDRRECKNASRLRSEQVGTLKKTRVDGGEVSKPTGGVSKPYAPPASGIALRSESTLRVWVERTGAVREGSGVRCVVNAFFSPYPSNLAFRSIFDPSFLFQTFLKACMGKKSRLLSKGRFSKCMDFGVHCSFGFVLGWIFSVFRFFVVSLKTADLFERIINTISSQSIHSVLVVHNEYGRRYKR